MKTITLLTVCFSILAVSNPNIPTESIGGPHDVEIKGHKNGQGSNNRGDTYYCTAFYYSSDSVLEINTYNVGNADVTLYDSNNNIVNTDSVSGVGHEQVLFQVPTRMGNYKVEVSSSEYYGEGYFANY